jgi:2-polyprenyl-6-methoxyphenol hydroxylase-like FAD-dependent oxidoreductase
MTQIHMERWWRGRVALVGDAAYCPSPASGQGTSLALVGARVLAGELAAAGGDHVAAFARYQDQMRGYVQQNQQLALESQTVEKSPLKFWLQTQLVRLFPYLPGKQLIMRRIVERVRRAANAMTLAPYPACAS